MFHTRIAPSPTGDMHIGTARTAYFNWLAAKSSGGTFTLRIDDTDLTRSQPEFVDVIFDTLKWLGLDYDRVVYQSHRFERYKEVASSFPGAFTENGAIIFNVGSLDVPHKWFDSVKGDYINITDNDIDKNIVLIKSDGSPTYHWASVIDDMDFGINYIIRGVDHTTNTSKQVVLWSLLGATIPKFAHIGLIASNKKLLSKRDGAASMLKYKDAGYDPDGMLNFLGRLGWGPTVDDKTTKMLPKEKMIELFINHGSMKSNQSSLDMPKLESFDRKYKAKKGIWRTDEKLM